MAQPLITIKRTKWLQDAAELTKHIIQQEAVGIVIGYPLNADGTEGTRCQSVRALMRSIESITDLPIILQDERYSTDVAVEHFDHGKKLKSSGRLDAAAATIILQSYLDGR